MQGSVGEDSGRASGRGRRLIECAGQLCGCGLCGVVIASDEGKKRYPKCFGTWIRNACYGSTYTCTQCPTGDGDMNNDKNDDDNNDHVDDEEEVNIEEDVARGGRKECLVLHNRYPALKAIVR